ncbi:MAG: AbrB/MazE/SpoVT family DNA-binding domain-containing protein [Candidatus Parcubacteria bacterium]|nr:AbrB/MazE/SpoVT family DNA-binding domain-containing protein [Candidatus Parcubacteria bacterium]
MQTIQLKQRGILTIPKKFREELGIFAGQFLRMTKKDNTLVIEPIASFDEQLSKDIRESLDDLKNGRYFSFSTIDEFDAKIAEKHENNTH